MVHLWIFFNRLSYSVKNGSSSFENIIFLLEAGLFRSQKEVHLSTEAAE
jgi:hypothetical protein